jgi:hypothetical protein
MNVGVIFGLNKRTCDGDVIVTEKSEVDSKNHLYCLFYLMFVPIWTNKLLVVGSHSYLE